MAGSIHFWYCLFVFVWDNSFGFDNKEILLENGHLNAAGCSEHLFGCKMSLYHPSILLHLSNLGLEFIPALIEQF